MEQLVYASYSSSINTLKTGIKEMKKKYLAALALATTALFSVSAHAGYVLIDDFSEGNQFLSINYGNQSATMVNAFRSLSMTYVPPATDPDNPQSSSSAVYGGVANGVLDISNPTGLNGLVRVGWNIGADSVAAGASNLQFLFTIVQSDGNPTNAKVYLDGALISSDSIPGFTNNQNYGIAVDSTKFGVGESHKLELELSGIPGWDLKLDAVGFASVDTPPTKVPEPASLALVSLGLLGVGAARRRVTGRSK